MALGVSALYDADRDLPGRSDSIPGAQAVVDPIDVARREVQARDHREEAAVDRSGRGIDHPLVDLLVEMAVERQAGARRKPGERAA